MCRRQQLSRGSPPAWQIVVGARISYPNNLQYLKTFNKPSDLDWSLGTTQTVEKRYAIWHVEC